MRSIIVTFLITLLAGVVAACAPTPAASSAETPTSVSLNVAGNAGNGAQLFSQGRGDAPACSTCHNVSSGQTEFKLGPNLAGIGEQAGTRIEGLSAEQYLHQSIVEPGVHLVSGFRDLMYPNYATHFNEEEIRDIIAYLFTLEG